MSYQDTETWRPASLGELGEVNRGRSRHRPRYAEHLYGGPYPFIQTGDVKASDGRIRTFTQTYSEAGLTQSRLWPAGTMCITIAANIAETGILQFPACFPDSIVGFVADPLRADVRFIEYSFRSLKQEIQHQASGSVQDNINLETLARLKIQVPPLPVQRAIADVLGALDDKIAANDRSCDLTAELSRAIFSQATVGGVRVSIGEVACMTSRGIAPTYVPSDGILVLNQRCVRNQIVSLAQGRLTSPDLRRQDKLLRRNDVLVNSTGQGTLGRVARWLHEVEATVDSHISIVRFEPSLIDPVCAGYALQQLESQIEALAEGSTGQTELRRDLLTELSIDVPPRELQADLGEQLSLLDDLAMQLRSESQRLTATRDDLLPLLMSGRIRVRDAEKAVEEVT